MDGDTKAMGRSQARHFLKTFLKAVSTHDYEWVEQLRRILAVAHYRKAINNGIHISEREVVPKTTDVEKWLARLDNSNQALLDDIERLISQLDAED